MDPHHDHPHAAKEPLLYSLSENRMHDENKMDELEHGLVKNLYVDSKSRRALGAIIIIVSIIGFVWMAIKGESNHGICPEGLSLIACFSCYGALLIAFLLGTFIACGLIGLMCGCECCELCVNCGQLFALCSLLSE